VGASTSHKPMGCYRGSFTVFFTVIIKVAFARNTFEGNGNLRVDDVNGYLSYHDRLPHVKAKRTVFMLTVLAWGGIAQSVQWQATGYRRPGNAIYFSSPVSRPVLGSTQSRIQWVPVALSPGAKRQRRKADHSPLSSAEVNNVGPTTPLPHMSSWSCLTN
jgi:hypothetical protein